MEKDTTAIRASALAFLKDNRAGVLATVSGEGKPHASVIYYVADDAFNIYFLTKLKSRKFTAIQTHPNVAFAVGRLDLAKTLQVEGVAVELTSEEDKAAHVPALMEMLAKNNPSYLPIAKMDAEVVVMWIQAKWIRWGDFTVSAIGNENVFTEIALS